ncbi:MAG: tetratricopeptide repeat protein [bacterium]|nr:tetratricopeptide repeat protein [bacterium]
MQRTFGILWTVAALVVTSGQLHAKVSEPYFNLGNYQRTVTSSVPEADRWFQRGLLQAYGFNHEEAVRCFEKATELEPDFAMAYWGIAYALGPNYNNPVMESEASKRAYESIEAAIARKDGVSGVERDLIDALAKRYEWPIPEDREDRAPLDTLYADAMQGVYERHPDDADVAALYAEAIMQLRPWHLWARNGKPAPGTSKLRQVLETSLERWPDNPALCHLYIHTMEPSPTADAALDAAHRLRNRVPDAGHLVHMPSHIYVLMGDYENTIETNLTAIEADERFVKREGKMNFFTLYRVHNYHFVVYGAMFDGQRKLAMRAAEQLVREIPGELLEAWPDFVEAFIPTPLHVQVRFGRWKDILKVREPPENQPYTRAIWHYARTLSYATLNRVDEARAELERLQVVAAGVPESRVLFNNTCEDILRIAIAMAMGEVEYRRGDFDTAFRILREAVRLDDRLNYDEPWGWMQPVRHALGALLLEQGHVEEAEEVYRADLKRHPKNGWALHGLAESLRRQGETAEASECDSRFRGAWTRSDTRLKASCFCRTGDFAGK